MQRLNRLRDDRGAVAVWVALLMVPMMIVAALAIDVGSLHADRQRLQTGADAAALAIAQQCAGGACGDEDATAQELADANEPQGGPVVADVVDLDTAAGYVEVETSSERGLWFGAFAGEDDASQTRVGAAGWGAPSGGPAVLPITFGECELSEQFGFEAVKDLVTNAFIRLEIPEDGVTRTIQFTKTSETPCTGPSGNVVPGGFGWLDPSGPNCAPAITELGMVGGDTGAPPPTGCTAAYFDSLINETVLLPVFDSVTGSGSNAQYRLVGYVAFKFESYYFTGGFRPAPHICHGNERCVQGTFLNFVELGGDFETDPDAPNLGSSVVELRLPEGP
ncbi:MAG: pilus assembly protein TadG-related protein [Actinomycetota bacterium]